MKASEEIKTYYAKLENINGDINCYRLSYLKISTHASDDSKGEIITERCYKDFYSPLNEDKSINKTFIEYNVDEATERVLERVVHKSMIEAERHANDYLECYGIHWNDKGLYTTLNALLDEEHVVGAMLKVIEDKSCVLNNMLFVLYPYQYGMIDKFKETVHKTHKDNFSIEQEERGLITFINVIKQYG